MIGVFVVWAALFLGSDMGYRAWQSMPDPPDEAFSDASVLGALILGWVPGVVFCAAVFVVGRSIRWLLRRANPVVVQNDSPFQSPTTDSGNPYQSPRS